MTKAIKHLLDDGRYHVEDAELKLTHIPQWLIRFSTVKLGVLESPIGKAIVLTEKHMQNYGCSCGKFIVFIDGKTRMLSVPCTTCIEGLELAECEALLGALAIKPGDDEHAPDEFVPGLGQGIIRIYRGGIEEITLDERQVRRDLEKHAFDAQI